MILSAYTRTVAPVDLVASVDDVKLSARVTHATEDSVIELLIRAAAGWVEQYTHRALLTQTYRMALSAMPRRWWLPMAAPLQSVSSVQYYDAANALQTWSSGNYLTPASHEPAMIEVIPTATLPTLYSRSDAVLVTYVAGWSDPDDVPAELVQAVTMLAVHWYENREAALVGTISKEIEFGVTALCAPYRLWWREACLQ